MTQNEKVIEHIEKYGGITALEAINEYGILRLASRISDLRKRGYEIEVEHIPVTTRYGEKTYVARYSFKESEVKQCTN